MLSLTLHTASVTKGGNYSCCPSRRKQCRSLYHILLQNDKFEITSTLTLKTFPIPINFLKSFYPGRYSGGQVALVDKINDSTCANDGRRAGDGERH